jgi:sigma-E factor negative regulatory protein RseA
MSEESHEHLSCLMDGEISRETGRFLVRRLGADQELCAAWARYHLVRDCLRHHEGSLVSTGLSTKVQQAIENEAAPRPAARRTAAWLKPAAGLAVAASVALLAIVAVGPDGQPVSPAGEGSAAAGVAESFTSPQALTPPPISQQASLAGQRAGDNRMNAYLLRHYQATGSTGGKGFVTFVPIVIRSSTAQTAGADSAEGASREAEPDEAAER